MKFLTIITTYNRADLCMRLAREIIREAAAYGKHTVILCDDASMPAYSHKVVQALRDAGIDAWLLRSNTNMGKSNYWRTVHGLYQATESHTWNYVVQLPDDVMLKAGFYRRAKAAYDAIPLASRTCLNLLRDHRNAQWGSSDPVPYCFGGIDVRLTGWMDLCFIATRDMMIRLQYSVERVHRDWARMPGLGSGVGAQISRRLRADGATIWQVDKSLVICDGTHDSKMNPERTLILKAI